MRQQREYYKGEILGNFEIVFIKETECRNCNGKSIRSADFQCHCGKIFNTVIDRVRHNRLRSCGCYKLKLFINNIKTHGLSYHPVYWVWKHIRERTTNIKHKQYKHYGGRGIIIFPPWREDFQLFYDYVSSLPNFGKEGYSIDRIDNNGNYEHGNLRWVTRSIQNINRRTFNKTGFRGIYQESENCWSFSVGKYKKSGFNSLNLALIARKNYIISNNFLEYKSQIKNFESCQQN